MKQLFFSLCAVCLLLLPSVTSAQEDRPFFRNDLPRGYNTPAIVLPNLSALITGNDTSPKGTLISIVNTVIRILGFVAGLAAFGFVLYGGFKYTMAGGDQGQVNQAKQMIAGAIIGILIFALSLAVVRYLITNVANITTGSTTQKK